MSPSRSALFPTVRLGACSDVGLVRSENEDAYGRFPQNPPATASEHEQLFVVADGMGGHAEGARASRYAIEAVGDAFSKRADGTVEERLRAAFDEGNARVYRYATERGIPERMGTTCTALALVGRVAYLTHVGDSRVYRVDASGIVQLSEDHTLVGALLRDGVLTEEEAARHPQRHMLLRALGVEPRVEVDVQRLGDVRSGEAYLLCSDGLALVPDTEVYRVVRDLPPQEAAEALVQAANDRGGSDNVTVLVVAIE